MLYCFIYNCLWFNFPHDLTLCNAEHPNADPADILPDGRFNHISQVQERLQFLRSVCEHFCIVCC